MSPEPEVTPASPTPQIPVEPTADTTTKNDKNESKETPKVIPLERDPRQFMRTKPATIEKQQQKFDIRAPKDWHRGLRGHQPSSSASPSSECSDDSDKGGNNKRLQIVESSPASSSPASPASGESLMNKPPSLPTPVPSKVPSVSSTESR